MDVLVKYTKMFGGGAGWNYDEGATYHATDHGLTLCGRGKPDAPRNGNASERGWELLRGRSKSDVNCSWCLKKIAKELR